MADNQLNERLNNACATALSSLEDKAEKPLEPESPIEMMYDDYCFYDSMFITLERADYPLSEFITDKEGNKLKGAELVQYVFRLHSTEISPEQADAFKPFLYFESITNSGGGTDDEPDNQLDIDIKNLFESQDFWENIKAMYDYYTAIEPHLVQELDKLYDLYPDIKEDNWVTLNNLKALLFVYKDFPEEELESLFEKCRHSRPKEIYMQHIIPFVLTYYSYFEYIYKAVKAARQAVSKEIEPIKEDPLRKRQIPQVSSIVKKFKSVTMPLDKPNRMLDKWAIGKTTLIDVAHSEDKRKHINVNIIASLDYTDISASRPLTPFDRRAFFAIANLIYNGQSIMTETQIHKLMGGKGKPNAEKKAKIRESVETIVKAIVKLDNREEADRYKSFEHYEIEAYLVPGEILRTVNINGQIVNWALRVLEVPRLFQFAIDRKQCTSIPLEIMQQNAISNTNDNIDLIDYIYYRISRMKSSKVSRKILFETLIKVCKIDTRYKKSRLVKDKLLPLLNDLSNRKWIKGYSIDSDGVTIEL